MRDDGSEYEPTEKELLFEKPLTLSIVKDSKATLDEIQKEKEKHLDTHTSFKTEKPPKKMLKRCENHTNSFRRLVN